MIKSKGGLLEHKRSDNLDVGSGNQNGDQASNERQRLQREDKEPRDEYREISPQLRMPRNLKFIISGIFC